MLVHKLKLRAPLVPALSVRRPELERRVLDNPGVVAVTAAPGYGKTTLAVDALNRWDGPRFWYGLDESDADLSVFAAHVDAGLRALGIQTPPFDAENASALGSPKEVGWRFAEALGEAQRPPLLVFDDVHHLEKSRSLAALSEMVERGCRAGARFILCGRTMPVPLHRVAGWSLLKSLTVDDLAFDDEEARRYLEQALDGDGSRADVAKHLAPQAEGWPAGLALIATSASARRRDGVAPEPAHDSGASQRFLFDYLASEVLESLDAAEQRFLLHTSILERLEVAGCAAVVPDVDAAAMLESLAARAPFVVRTGTDAFAVHQLFHDFLAQALKLRESAATISELHRRAAADAEARGDALSAADHYARAGDLSRAVALVERSAFALLRAGRIEAINSLLQRLGPDALATSATLLTAEGFVRRERGDWDAALSSLQRAVSLARESGEYVALAEAVRGAAPILASRNELAVLQGMLDEALALGPHLPKNSLIRLRMTSAATHLEQDHLDEALAMYREIQPDLVADGDLAAQGLVMHNAAVAQLRRGDIFAALATYERAVRLKKEAGQIVSLLHTMGDLAHTKSQLGDADDAEALVAEILEKAGAIGAASSTARAHDHRGLIALLRNDITAAREAFLAAQRACDPSDVLVMPEIEHGLARCALRASDLDAADAHCARAVEILRRTGRPQQIAPVLVTQAAVAAARGDAPFAVRLATSALDHAKQGQNALVEATTALEVADVLNAATPSIAEGDRAGIERRAAAAAGRAVALIHERNYHFLLRTKADVFERLNPRLGTWGVGAGLFGDGQPSSEPPHVLRIQMLGPFTVFGDGQPVSGAAWKRRKAPEVLAYLLAARGRAVSRARLTDLFWPEMDADSAHNALRVTVTAIRKVVGDIIHFDSDAYRIELPSAADVDVYRFDGLIEQARQAESGGDSATARRAYAAAAELYRGDFLDNSSDGGWQWRERERLRADCLEALRWLAKDALDRHDAIAQRAAIDRLLDIAPFDLDAVKMRLSALAAERRVADAIAAYETWRSNYRREIGVDAPEIWTPPADGEPATRPVQSTA